MNPSIRKFLALAVVLVLSIALRAQAPGSSMANPIILTPGPQMLNGLNPVGTETWYKWQTNLANAAIEAAVTSQGGSITITSGEVLVYDISGNLVTSDIDTLSTDSALRLRVSGLSSSDDIYIKINGILSQCPDCGPGGTSYNLALIPGGCWLKWYLNGTTPSELAGFCGSTTKTQNGYDSISICASTQVYLSPEDYYGLLPMYDIHIFTTLGPPTYNYTNQTGFFLFPFSNVPGTYTIAWTLPGTADNPTSPIFGPGNGTCCELVITVIPDANASFTINPSPSCVGTPVCFTGTTTNDPLYDMSVFKIYNSSSVLVATGPGTTYCATGLPAGTYTVEYMIWSSTSANIPITFPATCGDTTVMSFTIFSAPTDLVASATPTPVCAGQPVTLSSSGNGATSFTWQPGNLTGSTVTVSPTATTTYTVTATGPGGCTATSTVTVTTKICCTNNAVVFNNVTLVAPGTTLGATPWFTLVIGGSYSGNVEVPPSGTMFPATYSIFGSFTLNNTAGTTTFFGSEVIFDEAVQFTHLTPMTIDKSWFHACDKMWQGIGSLAYLKITNSIIEDANSAVFIFLITAHPGLLVDNTLFNRNQNGIVALFATVNTSSPNNFKITGSIFTCKSGFPSGTYTLPIASTFTTSLIGTNNIVSGFFTTIKGSPIMSIPIKRSEYGIAIAGASVTQGNFFNIGSSSSNSTTNSRLRNYFSYLNTGILNGGSKIDVVNCNFQQIVNFQGNSGNAGIHHSSGTPPNTITLVGDLNSLDKKCTFQNIQTGIKANGGGVLDASSNLFQTVIGNGVEVSAWNHSAGTVDVRQNTFTGCSIDFNAFNNNALKAVFQGNTSTSNFNSPYNVKIVESNPANTALYRVDGNNFTGKSSGIYMNTVNNANITDNTIRIGQNTTGAIFTADIWNENCMNCLFGNNILTSVSGNANKNSWSVFGIFTSMSTGNTYCSNDISEVGNSLKFQGYCVPSHVYSNQLDKGIVGIMLDVTGNTGHIGASSGSNWHAGENCFGNFTGAETYCQGGSNSPQANIYYNGSGCYFPSPNLASGANAFIPISTSLIPGGPICPSATFRMMNNNLPDLSVTVLTPGNDDYIGRKETYYLVNTFPEYAGSNTQFINESRNISIAKFFKADSLFLDFINTGNTSSLNLANSISAGIIAENIVEVRQKEFNSIYFNYLSGSMDSKSGFVESLREIAKGCPYLEGNSVYQSRALLSKFDDKLYVNDCEFQLSQLNLENETAPDAASDLLYPNPATNEITIKTSGESSTVGIYSILGENVGMYTLHVGENKLDISSLAAGTYFFKVISGSAEVKVHKVEVIK
jgi:hypothetical protein